MKGPATKIRVDVSQLRGRWALVTGASAGIGREFATSLAAEGMNVVLIARREVLLEALARDLRARHRVEAVVVPIDLASPHAVAVILESLRSRSISVCLLCNNGAFGHWGHFDERDVDFYQRMIQVNVATPVALCRALLPDLTSAPTAVIINVTSGAAYQPVPYMTVYAATKAFLSSFSLALHAELASSPVLVQTLVPGPTATEFDVHAGAPPLQGRAEAAEVVAVAIRHLRTGVPVAAHATGIYMQRLLGAILPVRKLLNEVEKRFRPPPRAQDGPASTKP